MPIDNSTRFPKPLAADLRELSEGMAIVIDGDTAPKAIASGQYLFIKNHSTLATGGYHATAAIASGADITSSNVTPDADGIVNGAFSSLSEHIANYLVVRRATITTPSIAPGGDYSWYLSNMTVDEPVGYSLIAALPESSRPLTTWNAKPHILYHNGYYSLHNNGTAADTCEATFVFLYIKN